MAVTNIDVAKQIVNQYITFDDPALTEMLETTKGTFYRPWFVAGMRIWGDYRQLTKADIVNFAYDKEGIKGLYETQKAVDVSDSGIPDQWKVDNFLALLGDNATGEIHIYSVY